MRKEGAGFDLPMALGILGAMGAVNGLDSHILVGELSLDGAIRPVRGALSVAVCARDQGIPNLILPAENAAEAAVVEGVRVYGVRHLAEVVALLDAPGRVHTGRRLRRTGTRPNRRRRRISATSAGRPWPSARWKWPRPGRTTC